MDAERLWRRSRGGMKMPLARLVAPVGRGALLAERRLRRLGSQGNASLNLTPTRRASEGRKSVDNSPLLKRRVRVSRY